MQISSGPSFGTCWVGSGWGACPNLLSNAGGTIWTDSLVPSNAFLVPGTTYQIQAQAVNAALNNSPIAISSFVFANSVGGCYTSTNVAAGVNTIQGAVNAAGASLAGNYCVFIGSGNYNEQVTIQNIATNGFQIFITSATSLIPVINPPATSTAAFVIADSSVNVQGINVSPANPITYGVYISSPFVTISNVDIMDANGKIGTAAIAASSWTSVFFTTVTEGSASAGGVTLNAANNAVIFGDSISGSPAVVINSANNASVSSSVLIASTSGNGLSINGAGNVAVLSNSITGSPLGAGLNIGAFTGVISLTADTIQGSPIGLAIAAQAGGESLTVNGLTFTALHPGATAINFAGGQFVSTFTSVAFNDPNISVNVAASALAGGSSITMATPAGASSRGLFTTSIRTTTSTGRVSNPPTSAHPLARWSMRHRTSMR